MIRYATLTDIQTIIDIYNCAIPERLATADTELVTAAARTEWFRAHSQERHPLWVLEDAGSVRAWCSLGPFYGRPAYSATNEVSVYVDASARRSGFASRLLEHALLEAPRLGVRTLLAFVFAHNLPSLALFRRFEFECWGTLPRVAELDGTERDLLILGRRT